MKSANQSHFSLAPSLKAQRSLFNLSHARKQTFDAGYIVPVYVDEALPGDTFTCTATMFGRLSSSLKYPIMDNLYLDVFFFAVPLRLVWENFQLFMGEKPDPDYVNTHTLTPKITTPAGGYSEQSLMDFMGIPINVEIEDVCAFYSRAYNLIWNEWFRDQNLMDSVVVDKDDGPDLDTDYQLLKRCKRPDYFTSCLPWPQKGDAVEIPLGTEAPVIGNGMTLGVTDGSGNYGLKWDNTYGYAEGKVAAYGDPLGTTQGIGADGALSESFGVSEDPDYSGLIADLSGATAATINSLRLAYQMQKFLERDARGGTRYTEIIKSHFSVISPDSRLQRPEYLGGGTVKILINPVQQTAPTSGVEYKGSLAANAVFGGGGIGFNRSFTEHSVILGLVCVRADQTYQYGIPRKFLRDTKYDFAWPEFAHLGEQEILRKEIYADGTATDQEVFGYQERYAEYRYHPNEICGYFRENATGTLNAWHLAQTRDVAWALDEEFISESVPIARVVAVSDGPDIIFDSIFDLKVARCLPTYSIPGWVDHF